MTTSGENENTATVRDGLEGWRETVAAARQARRQRHEPYLARHRRTAPADSTDTHDIAERSA
jgi:hypothetical protein